MALSLLIWMALSLLIVFVVRLHYQALISCGAKYYFSKLGYQLFLVQSFWKILKTINFQFFSHSWFLKCRTFFRMAFFYGRHMGGIYKSISNHWNVVYKFSPYFEFNVFSKDLTLKDPFISESCIEIKIYFNVFILSGTGPLRVNNILEFCSHFIQTIC